MEKNFNTSLLLCLTTNCIFSNVKILFYDLTLYVPIPQNGQTHSNNLSALADELFECVWPFCGVDALRVKRQPHKMAKHTQINSSAFDNELFECT